MLICNLLLQVIIHSSPRTTKIRFFLQIASGMCAHERMKALKRSLAHVSTLFLALHSKRAPVHPPPVVGEAIGLGASSVWPMGALICSEPNITWPSTISWASSTYKWGTWMLSSQGEIKWGGHLDHAWNTEMINVCYYLRYHWFPINLKNEILLTLLIARWRRTLL